MNGGGYEEEGGERGREEEVEEKRRGGDEEEGEGEENRWGELQCVLAIDNVLVGCQELSGGRPKHCQGG